MAMKYRIDVASNGYIIFNYKNDDDYDGRTTVFHSWPEVIDYLSDKETNNSK